MVTLIVVAFSSEPLSPSLSELIELVKLTVLPPLTRPMTCFLTPPMASDSAFEVFLPTAL